ncbi:SRPBCC family protein [Mariniflexile sp. AS56]|uniref:SRPBCC family protein n=1 Tax=Mariniflexile sp. AS56 TaxID=3063957 RepID=UPI0026F1EB35|nr:SRPBCC family protein [Mariniflexile sp. AS56]MDO7173324.1 SRPBCC family protein [Mariniflexile sp. AS56]
MKSKIIVEVIVNAALHKVWDFWTIPKHIVKWNFASNDWCCPKAANDLRVGGQFSIRMSSKDGIINFDFEGVYKEVITHKKIAYTMADGRQVMVIFEENGHETKLTEVFDPENLNSVEMQQNGWLAILNNFKAYVESK